MADTDNNQPDLPGQWPFLHRVRVRWAEADMQGVVFNGNYLTYFDIGITEYLRAVFKDDTKQLHEVFDDLYVVSTTMQYAAPAHFDEEIDVAVKTGRIGNSSLTFDFQIFRGDEKLVGGQNIYVHAPGGESAAVPKMLRDAIEQFEAG